MVEGKGKAIEKFLKLGRPKGQIRTLIVRRVGLQFTAPKRQAPLVVNHYFATQPVVVRTPVSLTHIVWPAPPLRFM